MASYSIYIIYPMINGHSTHTHHTFIIISSSALCVCCSLNLPLKTFFQLKQFVQKSTRGISRGHNKQQKPKLDWYNNLKWWNHPPYSRSVTLFKFWKHLGEHLLKLNPKYFSEQTVLVVWLMFAAQFVCVVLSESWGPPVEFMTSSV